MTRLTNFDRDTIAAAACKAAFTARHEALAVAADALARRCYEAVFSVSARKAAAAMPAGWLRRDSCLYFNVGGLDVKLDTLDEGVPVPSTAHGYCSSRLGAVSDPELVADVQKHLDTKDALKTEQKSARAALDALLGSVTTLKALRLAWPDGEPFFTSVATDKEGAKLPAPHVAELNAMLGLTAAA